MSAEEFEGKNLVELLDMLEQVPEPTQISMWPETQGWIWLGLVVLVLLFLGVWRLRVVRNANAYRRAALAELAASGDDPVAIADVLRRTALSAYPRQKVAGLAGDDWLAFLDVGYNGQGFATETGRAMLSSPYRADPTPIDGLAALARDWVQSHKSEAHT